MLGEAVIRLRADATGMTQGISTAKRELTGLARTATEAGHASSQATKSASGGFSTLTGSIKQTHAAALSLRSGIMSVAGGIGAANLVAKAFGAAKQAIIGFNSLQEQTMIGFTTMLGSGEKAKALMNDLKEFATKTPFEFQTLIGTAQQMMALGFQGEQLIPSLTAIGDAVAALGGSPEVLNRVTRALGQIQAKGKVSAEEMLQLAEAGIPAWKYLAETLGTTIPEAMKINEKQGVASKIAIDGLLAGMERDFGGMMAAQSKTLQGALSNVTDYITQVSASITKPLYDSLQKGVLAFAAWLQGPQAKQIGDNLSKWIGDAIKTIQQVVGMTVTAIAPAIEGLIRAFQNIAPVVGNFMDALKTIGVVAGGAALMALKAIALVIEGVAIALKPLVDLMASNRVAIMLLVSAWLVFKAVHTGGWIDQISASVVRMAATTKAAGVSSLGFLSSLSAAWKSAAVVSKTSAVEIAASTAMMTETQSGLTVVRNFQAAQQGAQQTAGVMQKLGAVAGTAGLAASSIVPVLGTIAVTAGMIGVTKWMEGQAEKAREAAAAEQAMVDVLKQFEGSKLATPEGISALLTFIGTVKGGELKKTGADVGLMMSDIAQGFEDVATGADKGAGRFAAAFVHLNDDVAKFRGVVNKPFGEAFAEDVSKTGYMGGLKAMRDIMPHLSDDAAKHMGKVRELFKGSRVMQDWADAMQGQDPEKIRAFMVSVDDLLRTQLRYGRDSKEFKAEVEKATNTLEDAKFAASSMGMSITAVGAQYVKAGYNISSFGAQVDKTQDMLKQNEDIFAKALDPMKRLDFSEAIGLGDFEKNLRGNLDDVRHWADNLQTILRDETLDPALARDTAEYFRNLGTEASAKMVEEFVHASPDRKRDLAASLSESLSEAARLSPLQLFGDKFVNVDQLTASLRAGMGTIDIAQMIGVDRDLLKTRLNELSPVLVAWAQANDARITQITSKAGQQIAEQFRASLASVNIMGEKTPLVQFKIGTDPMEVGRQVDQFFSNLPEGTFKLDIGKSLTDQFREGAESAAAAIKKGEISDAAIGQFKTLFDYIDQHKPGKKPLAEMLLSKESKDEAMRILESFVSGDYTVKIKTEMDTAFAQEQLHTLLAYVKDPSNAKFDALAKIVVNNDELMAMIAAAQRGDFDMAVAILSHTAEGEAEIERWRNSQKGKPPIVVPVEVLPPHGSFTLPVFKYNPLTGESTRTDETFSYAMGGILKWFANGGIENHVAQFAKGGPTRIWNEPETGGESYIPWARSKRARSMRVLVATANAFNHEVVPMADGGMLGTMPQGEGAAGGGFTLVVQGNVYGDEAFKRMMKHEVDKRDRRIGIGLARKGR